MLFRARFSEYPLVAGSSPAGRAGGAVRFSFSMFRRRLTEPAEALAYGAVLKIGGVLLRLACPSAAMEPWSYADAIRELLRRILRFLEN